MKLNFDPHALRAQYTSADPFPHIVLDGLFDDARLEAVLRDFPAPNTMQWRRFDNTLEKKLGYFHESSVVDGMLHVRALRRLLLDPRPLHGSNALARSGGREAGV